MWRSLWWSPKRASPVIDYSQSIAGPPVYSNANKTVTVHLYPGWKWSDGTPITSKDLAFDYWLLEGAVNKTVGGSPANYGDYTPGLYPDNVTSVATPNASTFVINFNKGYNQNFIFLEELAVLEPLPAQAWSKTSLTGPIIPFDNLKNAAAIYKFLNAQSNKLSTYGSNPLWQVVDGPFKIKSFDPATDGNTLVANPAYTGPVKPHLAGIDDVAFTSTSSEFDQLLTGKLDVGFIDFSDLPRCPTWSPTATASSATPILVSPTWATTSRTRTATSTTSSASSTSAKPWPTSRTNRPRSSRAVCTTGPPARLTARCRPYR